MVNVTVWNEYQHERDRDDVREVYPKGIHAVLADALEERGHNVRAKTLEDPEHGLTAETLAWTDVLLWWGHAAHDEVEDRIVSRVKRAVLDGMGLIALHSSHESKVFKALMGTSGTLRWRESGERERLWVVEPAHPIAVGLDDAIEIPKTEMYGERFDVPAPDTLVFISWFEGGEVFRSGCCYRRGNGRIFYFRPGHETFPIYHQAGIQRVIGNAVDWAAPAAEPDTWTETYHARNPPEPPEREQN